jgi:hypothetical protein
MGYPPALNTEYKNWNEATGLRTECKGAAHGVQGANDRAPQCRGRQVEGGRGLKTDHESVDHGDGR